jgi:hypothetical protein
MYAGKYLINSDDFCISHLQVMQIIPLIWEIFAIILGLEQRKDVFWPLNNMERFGSPNFEWCDQIGD